jgi:hypothetical protein
MVASRLRMFAILLRTIFVPAVSVFHEILYGLELKVWSRQIDLLTGNREVHLSQTYTEGMCLKGDLLRDLPCTIIMRYGTMLPTFPGLPYQNSILRWAGACLSKPKQYELVRIGCE